RHRVESDHPRVVGLLRQAVGDAGRGRVSTAGGAIALASAAGRSGDASTAAGAGLRGGKSSSLGSTRKGAVPCARAAAA
ncbi:MAG TPA: hypothetical protein PK440_20080, partial [Candidatus Accumulibacter phosphatis]|nr:hypothetical protein [Candidatus Accumulibacter phosphatis]